jgi:hypothetical protein
MVNIITVLKKENQETLIYNMKILKTYTEIIQERNTLLYRGFYMYKNTDLSPGSNGYWHIPKLYYRDFANKIKQGYDTVSMTQGRDAIDEWYDFNQKVKKYK